MSDMRTNTHSASAALLAAALGLVGLSACGGGENGQNDGAGAETAADTQSSPAIEPAAPAETEPEATDETAEGALVTYVERCKIGDIDAALEVCAEGAPGTEKLREMGEGFEKARAEGAPVDMAIGLLAGEIEQVSWEKISDDGETAVFELSSPQKNDPWTIEVVRTADGWRVKPPPGGMPTG